MGSDGAAWEKSTGTSKDTGRPFIVEAGGIEFRAVGTAFAVSRTPAKVELHVTEGRVDVETPAAATGLPAHAVAEVGAGNRVIIDPANPVAAQVSSASGEETRAALAWRVPRLEFNDTPLCEVVQLLSRHSGVRIGPAEERLGRVEISGALRADNAEPLFQLLQTTYGITATIQPDGGWLLRPGR